MSYQHMDPQAVGNRKRVLVSELSGRGNIVTKALEVGIDLSNDKERVEKVLRKVKEQENKGFQYEGADASFELLVHKAVGDYKPVFELVDYMVVMDRRQVSVDGLPGQHVRAQAMVKVRVGESVYHNAADGDGPVNALDGAFRKALREHYSAVDEVKLIDYKVRILEETAGTAAHVRVLIESTDGKSEWRTVGSSTDIIEASWMALSDSLEYFLLKQGAGVQHPVGA
jgi:2-isopropylmalate synthase